MINEIGSLKVGLPIYLFYTNIPKYGKYSIFLYIYIKKYVIMEKRLIRLTESKLHNIIKECVVRILRENFGSTYRPYTDSVAFILMSRANGNLKVVVPYREFMGVRDKIDYLWHKCGEQNTVNVMGNGYFMVSPNDPHKEEIERWF